MNKWPSDIPVIASWTVTTYVIHKRASKCSRGFETTKTAKTEYMDFNSHSALCQTMIKGPRSMTLRWRTFPWWGRERVAYFFVYKGWQHSYYVWLLPNCVFSTQLTGPEMIDAPLTLIFKMGQGVSGFLFCIYTLSMLLLCITTTKLLFN